MFVVAFGLYDVDNSGLIDESEFLDLARNMLVGQANGVRVNRTHLHFHSQNSVGRRRGRHDSLHARVAEEFSLVCSIVICAGTSIELDDSGRV